MAEVAKVFLAPVPAPGSVVVLLLSLVLDSGSVHFVTGSDLK